MGIERLTSSLLLEANKEAADIISAAESHVQKMVEEERARNKELESGMEEDVDRILDGQKNERIAWARLEAKRILAEAREDAIKNVLEGFFEALSKGKQSKEYKEFMGSAVKSAISELGTSGLVVHVCKGEGKLVKVKGVKVVQDLDALGGAIVESKDGNVRVNLTLEMLFESRRDELRKKISDKLFGGK
ncbi:MAG: V-type ATP synthase subunit E family protein [Candidatus Micrarchaeota archaeon]